MCQVTVKYSENLPSTEPNSFKTHHFTVELTEKVADDQSAVDVATQLFRVAKAQVKSEIMTAVADLAMNHPAPQQPQQVPFQQHPQPSYPSRQPSPAPHNNGTSTGFKPASPKQINYILTLAKKQGLKEYEIKNLPMSYFNAPGFNALSQQQASDIIESLSGKRQAA